MKALIIFVSLFLLSLVFCNESSVDHHYKNPFSSNCSADETILGDKYRATCSRNCNYQACPTDMPTSGINLTPVCMPANEDGDHFCALACPKFSFCPLGSKCMELNIKGGNFEDSSINKNGRILQIRNNVVKVCLYDDKKVHMLPGVINDEEELMDQ